MKKIIKIISNLIISITLLLIVVISIIGFAVYKPESRNFFISGIAEIFATRAGYNLQIKNLDTTQPDEWKIDSLVFSKSNKQILQAKSINMKWRPMALFTGKLIISKLNIEHISLNEKLDGKFSADFQAHNSWLWLFINVNASFKGHFNKIPLEVELKGNGTEENFSIAELKINTDQQGLVSLSGNYSKDNINLKAKASALPTQIISAMGWSITTGKLTADLEIKGSQKNPLASGTIKFASHISDKKQKIPMEILAKISTPKQILNADIYFNKNNEKLGNLNLKFPIPKYPYDFKENFPITSSLIADFDLKYLKLLLNQDSHKIKGHLKADIALKGSLKKPSIIGDIELKNGYYENDNSGTILQNINAKVKAENTRITIINANSTDSEKGKLTLSGTADWSDKLAKSINFELNADKAKILRRNDMEGVASGSLKLAGSFKELTLEGSLHVTPFTMILDNLLIKDIPEIKITEENEDDTEDYKSKTPALIPIINMDIALIANNQAYLRGAGLDAELKGKILVKGTLNNSQYSGSFKTIRGSYEILGKKFTLHDGSIRFEGNSVTLLIPGVHKNKTAEIRAELSGTLEELNLTLSSTPSMPQDEIVSNLLFGKSSQNISPLQAIRLANAIRNLKGGGKELFNPVEKARKLIGVDNISIDSEKTENGEEITVGVGKYINEKVYIELEKGNSPSQTLKGRVEAEILPNLNIESSTGGNAGVGGVELRWKYDY